MKLKSSIILFLISMIVSLYTTFVLVTLWDWFAVPAFHVSEISFWVMYGLNMLIGVLQPHNRDIETEHRHKILAVALDACIPDNKREDVKRELEELGENTTWEAGWLIFGQLVTNSLTLGVGFAVHLVAS